MFVIYDKDTGEIIRFSEFQQQERITYTQSGAEITQRREACMPVDKEIWSRKQKLVGTQLADIDTDEKVE